MTEKELFYTKQNLFDTISFLELIPPLLNIICDYCYQLRYRKYTHHKLDRPYGQYYRMTVTFKNLLIQSIDGACSIKDIAKNEILYKRNNIWYTSQSYDTPRVRDNEIVFEAVLSRPQKDIPKLKVKSTIYFSENDGEYKFNEGKLFETSETFETLETLEYSPVVQENIVVNNSVEKVIDIDQVILELNSSLKDSITFDPLYFNIDLQGFFSGIFYLGKNKEIHLLEYDTNKKRILDYYVLEEHIEDYLKVTEIIFDNEYMTVYFYDTTASHSIQFRKVLI
jgi:hypothetical protein